jgi:uncharacterized protein YkwD
MNHVNTNEDFRQKLIQEINSARQNPQEYAKKVRKYATYFKGKIMRIPECIPIMTTEGAKAYEDAAFFLDNLNRCEPLSYSPGLAHTAHDSLLEIQKFEDLDDLSSLNIENYLEKHGTVVGLFAQAVDFGSSYPELVVINLLVDDGDLNRGNRQNIFNPKFRLIGVSTGTHSVYHYSTVIMYARHFYANNETVGDLSDENYEDEEPKKPQKRASLNLRKSILGQTEVESLPKLLETKASVKDEVPQEDDFDLPEGCLKVERQEKIIEEKGVKKRVVKLIKHMEDGSTETEIFKEKI